MTRLSETQLIHGFLEHDSRILEKFYKDCFPMIEKMIINTGGGREQAEDVFQDAMLIMYDKLLSGKFELKCKFTTYVYAVSKKIWFQEKRKNSRKKLRIDESFDMVQEPDSINDDDDGMIREIFNRHFGQLSPDCQKILKMHFNKINISEIQEIMGYESNHYTMDRKYRCKKSLIKRIINDPKFKSIKNEYSGQIRFIH